MEPLHADRVLELVLRASPDLNLADALALSGILGAARDQSLEAGVPLGSALGLEGPALEAFLRRRFPGWSETMEESPVPGELDEARCRTRQLLRRFRTGASDLELELAEIIARRMDSPGHLWKILGLRDRAELWDLMVRHFAPLVARNAEGMRWKKFISRMICLDGTGTCPSPTCGDCAEREECFGPE
jgi:nitrogen fixation protein NifQ